MAEARKGLLQAAVSGPVDAKTFQLVLRMLDQLEARVRELEGILIDTLQMKATALPVLAAKTGGVAYAQQLKDNPGQDHGPPQLQVFLHPSSTPWRRNY